MDRRWLVFPTIAATAVAQTPAMPAAEKALRARAEEFFNLQVAKKFRQAETLVAADAKDEYYSSNKAKIEAFKVQKVEFLPGHKRARVTILATGTVLIMGAGARKFDIPTVSSWKLENGKWCWYIDEELYRQTPFGTAQPKTGKEASASEAFTGFPAGAPKAEDFEKGIQIDKEALTIAPGGPAQQLTITNPLPSPVHVRMAQRSTPVLGLMVTPEVIEIKGGEKGVLEFAAAKDAQFDTFVDLSVEPLARTITVKVTTAK